MTALVTGATGLLGNNLVRALTGAGQHVRVVVRDVDLARRALAGLELEYVRGDIADVAAWAPQLRGVDVVYGCAAYFSEYYGPGKHDVALQRLNVDAAVQIARAADRYGVGAFVHTSTIGITGPATRAGDLLSDESWPPDRRAMANGYHASKWRAERALDAELGSLDVRVPYVRPGWLLGPGDGSRLRAPTASGQLVLDVARRQPLHRRPGRRRGASRRRRARSQRDRLPRGGAVAADARDHRDDRGPSRRGRPET
jgi:dihydroflavonol-4-reductase